MYMLTILKKPITIILVLVLIVSGIFVTQVSKPGTEIEGTFDLNVDRDRNNITGLRVFSLNFCHDFPEYGFLEERLALLSVYIRRHEPDIICLQEIPWTRISKSAVASLAQSVGFNYAYYRANGNRALIGFEEGQAILSRYPIMDTASTTLQPKAGFFENRTALYVRVDTPKGKIGVVSTHLSGNESVQEAQAQSLLQFVEEQAGEDPVIIAGDFNFTDQSKAYELLTQKWKDTYYFMHPDLDGFTCCVEDFSAGENSKMTKRVDYIFTWGGKNKKVVMETLTKIEFDIPIDVGSQTLRISDHAALGAEFSY